MSGKKKRKAATKRKVPARGKKGRKTPKSRPPLPPLEIDLRNLEGSKNAMAELIKLFYRRKISDQRARTLAFLYQTYLAFLKAEAEARWEKKLDSINRKLTEVMNP